MPLIIEGQRVYNKDAYLKHHKMKAELNNLEKYVRGGHPEYKLQIAELKKQITINKILA